jgi:hypothetical protein
MRAWLYNRINGLANRPASWVGKDIYSSAASDQPQEPFMIISLNTEQPPPSMPASTRTQAIPFTVWVHDRGSSMLRIDDACVWLKNNLPFEDGITVGNMSIYNLVWELTGDDAYDDHFNTNTRPVRFTMMTRR